MMPSEGNCHETNSIAAAQYPTRLPRSEGIRVMPPGIRIIGLTGGIATGKSSVALFFAERGVPVIDADQLARDAVLPGSPAFDQIISLFGRDIVTHDGVLNRKRLGALIFPDPEKRRQLEGILHPEIRKLAEERIAQAASSGHQRLIYMAPLLVEAGATDRVDTIWVVTVRPEIQLERLMRRDGINYEQAQMVVDSQMPLSEKERYGSVVIDNSGTEADTRMILETVWAKEIEEQ
jgi:dephospho-CoA kinase